jgi:hypothetical protein
VPGSGAPTGGEESVEQLRSILLGRITGVQDKMNMPAKRRAELWQEYCGHAIPENADPAALQDLFAHLVKLSGKK